MDDEESPWAEGITGDQQIANAEYQQLENRFYDVRMRVRQVEPG